MVYLLLLSILLPVVRMGRATDMKNEIGSKIPKGVRKQVEGVAKNAAKPFKRGMEMVKGKVEKGRTFPGFDKLMAQSVKLSLPSETKKTNSWLEYYVKTSESGWTLTSRQLSLQRFSKNSRNLLESTLELTAEVVSEKQETLQKTLTQESLQPVLQTTSAEHVKSVNKNLKALVLVTSDQAIGSLFDLDAASAMYRLHFFAYATGGSAFRHLGVEMIQTAQNIMHGIVLSDFVLYVKDVTLNVEVFNVWIPTGISKKFGFTVYHFYPFEGFFLQTGLEVFLDDIEKSAALPLHYLELEVKEKVGALAAATAKVVKRTVHEKIVHMNEEERHQEYETKSTLWIEAAPLKFYLNERVFYTNYGSTYQIITFAIINDILHILRSSYVNSRGHVTSAYIDAEHLPTRFWKGLNHPRIICWFHTKEPTIYYKLQEKKEVKEFSWSREAQSYAIGRPFSIFVRT